MVRPLSAADFDIGRRAPVFSEDGIETVWATNHIGPVLLTQQLYPNLSQLQKRLYSVKSRFSITPDEMGSAQHPCGDGADREVPGLLD